MPELPDVAVFKQYLDATALHRRIKGTSIKSRNILGNSSAQKLQRRLKGQKFQRSRRHGKYLFIKVSGEKWLALHFGMTGFLKYFKDAKEAPGHTRLLIEFSNDYQLAYDCQRKLGRVNLVRDVEKFIREKELGPDALDPNFDLPAFRQALGAAQATVKSALMNQKRLAGIGNIYSDEILFHAGLHPQSKTHGLHEKTAKRLFQSMKKVLRAAIRCRVEPDRFPSSYLLPHRNGDRCCPRCGQKLRRTKIGGRTSYYCSKHQNRRH